MRFHLKTPKHLADDEWRMPNISAFDQPEGVSLPRVARRRSREGEGVVIAERGSREGLVKTENVLRCNEYAS